MVNVNIILGLSNFSIIGDINLDETINVVDVIILVNSILG